MPYRPVQRIVTVEFVEDRAARRSTTSGSRPNSLSSAR